MNKHFFKDALGWGFIIWLIGYVLGVALFEIVPANLIGWIILPIGTIITVWVLSKRVKSEEYGYYLALSVIWALIAIILDHYLLVETLKPTDGYYKLDVYLYYTLTFFLPLVVGWHKTVILKRKLHSDDSQI